MLHEGDHVLTAISGGPDSVCLLTILNKLKAEYGIILSGAYIDHGLRPDEVPLEIDISEKLCNSLNIPFSVKAVDVKSYAKNLKLSKQQAARQLRYEALEGIALDINANKLALGHNRDDQVETMLIRLIIGSGPTGFSGISPVRKTKLRNFEIIRPLIEIEKTAIEKFLLTEKTAFTVDSSNLKDHYLRNRIRHFIVPEIKKINRSFAETISKTSEIFRDEERYFEMLVTKTLMKLITKKTEDTIELFSVPMEGMDKAILRRVIRRAIDETKGIQGIGGGITAGGGLSVGFGHIEDIVNLIKSGKSGDRIYLPKNIRAKNIMAKNIRAVKGYSTIIITSKKPLALGLYTINGPGEIVLKESSVVLKISAKEIGDIKDYGNGKNNAVVDASKISFPLTVRPRLPGDYFYPIGFGKKKKLQDFFVDEKIPRDERDAVPLIVSNSNIVWVAGLRLDDRYKVDKDTKRVLQLEIRPMKF